MRRWEATVRGLSPLRHGLLGAGLVGLAIFGLTQDIAWLAQPFYVWVWWGYILMLDGYSFWKRGDSLLTTRRRFFFPICIWSVTFWFFFELINARIQNWYYVGVFPFDAYLVGPVFTVAAFSTVFMGIFQTMDALNASGLWRHWRGPRRRFPPRLTYLLQGTGLLMGGVALLFPYYLAPLVWGSFTLIVDPWNYRRGARSLLRDIENGDYGLIARLLLSGLICGLVWESLNFFAPQKWIYTVRGLEEFKLFEMPLLGFLGFPALALDCMAAFAMFSSLFLGNRTWEKPEELSYELEIRPARSRAFFWSTAALQACFWAGVSLYATPINVGSYQVTLSDLGLTGEEMARLNARDITRPRQLLRRTDTPAKRAAVVEAFDGQWDRLQRMRQRAALYTFKGIGPDHGRALEQLGIREPADLTAWSPNALLAELQPAQVRRPVAPPRLDFVRVWIQAARAADDEPGFRLGDAGWDEDGDRSRDGR